jgi:hypothetical protein
MVQKHNHVSYHEVTNYKSFPCIPTTRIAPTLSLDSKASFKPTIRHQMINKANIRVKFAKKN